VRGRNPFGIYHSCYDIPVVTAIGTTKLANDSAMQGDWLLFVKGLAMIGIGDLGVSVHV